MRTLPIAAAALAIFSTTASAQMTTTTPHPASPPLGAIAAPTRAPAVNPLAQDEVSKIEGASVYGSDNDKVGHVSTVLMDPQSKKIDRLVVAAGGVLGVGSHRVALPIDRFTWDSSKGAFRVDTTTADLKAMPEWTSDQTMTGSSTAPVGKIPPRNAGDDTTEK